MLDEPTEGLDPLVQEAFFAMLDARRDAGRTMFLSSHVLPEVEELCERAAMIRGGPDRRRRARSRSCAATGRAG